MIFRLILPSNIIIMRLISFYKKQQFIVKPYSIFMNPFFIIRLGLYKGIKEKAKMMQGRLLDFGCGLKPYRSLFFNVKEYIGLDMENEGHSHEKEQIDVFYDGKTIPFGDGHFDSVFSSEVFEHVFDIEPILTELNRVLVKDGQILVSVPFAWNEHEIPNDFGRYTSFGLEHLLKKAGFEILESKKSGHFAAVIAQYIILYFYELLPTKNKFLKNLKNTILFFPLVIPVFLLSICMPRNKSLYFNNIILARKI
jgi:SAM-dependent methyltransferase